MQEQYAPVTVGVDGSKQAIMAARWAAAVADRFGVALRIVHAVPDSNYFASGLATAKQAAALEYLQESAQTILQDAKEAVRADFAELQVAAETVVQMPDEPATETLAEISQHAQLFVV